MPWLSPSTVERAANGLSNWRSTLITVMPAFMALSATGVSAAPSNGSSTIASTLSLMNVSTWLIWKLTSLVPSTTRSSTSEYLPASALAALVIAAIQPWSAAGAEKPMTTFLPGSSLATFTPPWFPPPWLVFSGVLPVQAVSVRPTVIAAMRSVLLLYGMGFVSSDGSGRGRGVMRRCVGQAAAGGGRRPR
jgi:hypothetical protein